MVLEVFLTKTFLKYIFFLNSKQQKRYYICYENKTKKNSICMYVCMCTYLLIYIYIYIYIYDYQTVYLTGLQQHVYFSIIIPTGV